MAHDPKSDEERARREAERKETEDLLAGFDRPGRTPRTPRVSRDFVDYHLQKRRSDPELQASGNDAEREQRNQPTAIIQRKRGYRAWLPWAALLAVMSLGGILVAAAALPTSNGGTQSSSTPPTTSTALASAATTIASGTIPIQPTGERERDIPPPPSTTSTATATADRVEANASPRAVPATPSARRPPTSAPAFTSPTSLPPSPSPAPSGSGAIDLIRNL